MHADELDVDADLVRRLLVRQFPQWAELPLAAVASSGTDNALFRLGTEMVVRLPRIHWAADSAAREQSLLARLAHQLPVAIPRPLGLGEPADGFPWRWSITTWLDGCHPVVGELADPVGLSAQLAGFVTVLRGCDAAGGPRSNRGVPLADRDAATRAGIAKLDDEIDTAAATAAWDRACAAPAWRGADVWIHGDLTPSNLLAIDGRLTAVIDWGTSGVGEPACDLLVAWNLLPREARAAFREAVGVDDATWERGRGWALSIAVIALPYYAMTNPTIATSSRHVIAEVLSDIAAAG